MRELYRSMSKQNLRHRTDLVKKIYSSFIHNSLWRKPNKYIGSCAIGPKIARCGDYPNGQMIEKKKRKECCYILLVYGATTPLSTTQKMKITELCTGHLLML